MANMNGNYVKKIPIHLQVGVIICENVANVREGLIRLGEEFKYIVNTIVHVC